MEDHIRDLEERGYTVIPAVYSPEHVERALGLVRHWYQVSTQALSDRMPFLNKDQAMVYNLQNKDPFFLELLFSSAEVSAILKHFLNDEWFRSVPAEHANYILRSFLARSSNHKMPIHIDSFIPYGGDYCFIMQFSILLEDQNEENGCTVVVPGSHRSGRYGTQDAFENAKPICARAGDCVMWDSRIWHGALENRSSVTRWAIIATMQRWWLKQAFEIPGSLPQAHYDALTDEQRAVLGFTSVPYRDETVGIDMKREYSLLPKVVSDYRD